MEQLRECIISSDKNRLRNLLKTGTNPDTLFNGWPVIMIAAKKEKFELVKVFLECGSSPSLSNEKGNTSLHIACENGNLEMVQLLIKYGANIDVKNLNNITPIHKAAIKGYVKIIDYLCKVGAEIDLLDKRGFSPLIMALHSPESTDLLIKYGAKITNKITEVSISESPLETISTLIKRGKMKLIHNHLLIAVDRGELNIIALIIRNLRNRDLEMKEESALSRAIKNEDWNVVNSLIGFGEKYSENESVSIFASRTNNETLLKLIIKNQNSGIWLKRTDQFGNTLLHVASTYNSINSINLLVKAGIDINSKNDIGNTPLLIAVKNGYLKATKILFQLGADTRIQNNLGENILTLASSSGNFEIIEYLMGKVDIQNQETLRKEFEKLLELGGGIKELNKLREMVLFNGIPSETLNESKIIEKNQGSNLRGKIWSLLLKSKPIDLKEWNHLLSLGQCDIKTWKKFKQDTFRTFMNDEDFSNRVPISRLDRTLNSWAHIRGDFEYVQGHNIMMGPLLYNMSDPEALNAFIALNNLIPNYPLDGALQGAHYASRLVDEVMKQVDPELFYFLKKNGIQGTIYAFKPALSLLASSPPLSEVMKLWDFIFAFGLHMNVFCVVAQIILLRDKILSSEQPGTITQKVIILNSKAVISAAMSIVNLVTPELYDEIVNHNQISNQN